MAGKRGSELEGRPDRQKGAADAEETQRKGAPERRRPAGETPVGLPDGIRRLIALGLSGVFSTQETLRQTVGDALPKEWVDFAADQSERTRAEFLERLAGELARTIESIDLARVMQQALEGRTLEVHARIRMLPDEDGTGGGGGLRITMTEDDES
jgi:hypothetical protein